MKLQRDDLVKIDVKNFTKYLLNCDDFDYIRLIEKYFSIDLTNLIDIEDIENKINCWGWLIITDNDYEIKNDFVNFNDEITIPSPYLYIKK